MAELARVIRNGPAIVAKGAKPCERRHRRIMAEATIIAEQIMSGRDRPRLEESLISQQECARNDQDRQHGRKEIQLAPPALQRGRTLVIVNVDPFGDLFARSVILHAIMSSQQALIPKHCHNVCNSKHHQGHRKGQMHEHPTVKQMMEFRLNRELPPFLTITS